MISILRKDNFIESIIETVKRRDTNGSVESNGNNIREKMIERSEYGEEFWLKLKSFPIHPFRSDCLEVFARKLDSGTGTKLLLVPIILSNFQSP